MKTVYVLFYGKETGDREDGNIFYTPIEVWDSKSLAEQRREELFLELGEDGFVEIREININTPSDI